MASAVIVYNKRLTESHYVMGLEWAFAGDAAPGQFIMLKVNHGVYDPLLRRPFGIYKVFFDGLPGGEGRTGIEILYKVVGRGTEILAGLVPDETVDILGPLGNGFPTPKPGEKSLLVAGGIGIAPIHLLALSCKKEATVIFGARDKSEAPLTADIEALGIDVKTVTEDGSAGVKGLVTDILAGEIRKASVIYACGPTGMLKAVAGMALGAGVRAYVSLENSMACGVGACLGCAVKRAGIAKKNKRYQMVCSEGPVFNSTEIDWESFS